MNHLLALVTHAIDVGAFTPFLWAFEQREKLIEYYEACLGARMHMYLDIIGLCIDLPLVIIDQIYKWFSVFPIKLQDVHSVLLTNRIWKYRLIDVGIINKKILEAYALSGIITRASKIKKDLRLLGYEYYSIIQWGVNTAVTGDCLDRYLIRMNECLESVKIIQQLMIHIKLECTISNSVINTIEGMIFLFICYFLLNERMVYVRSEAPKGENGLFIVSSNIINVYRVKIRSPD